LKENELQNVAIANALQLEAAGATPALAVLITTSCQVWCRRTYPLPYYSVFLLIHYFTMWPWPLTTWLWPLTFDLWPWTFVAYRLWHEETLYNIWTQSNNPRRSYCDFSSWPYDLEHVL